MTPGDFGTASVFVVRKDPPLPLEGSVWTAQGRWYQVPGSQWPTIAMAQAEPPYPAMREPALTRASWSSALPPPHWYLPYEYISVPITAGNVNPFDIDPEQTVAITVGNANPFDIDPEQTTLITVGLTAAD